MPVHLREIIGFLDETLESAKFRDYATNGLQVEGAMEVERVATGVSASAELIGRAVQLGADLIVVHHGLVWGGGIATITGPMRLRLKLLLGNDVSLAAYHLPLDKHARLGNNAGLADALGLEQRTWFGDVKGVALGLAGTVTPMSKGDAITRIGSAVCGGAPPRFVFPYGPDTIKKIGVCSGAASDLLEAAAAAGCDLFLTGELAERAGDLAKELQLTLVAAGHVATEVFGPMRLAEELHTRFALDAQFVHVPSPL